MLRDLFDNKKQNPARRVSIEAGKERKRARQVLDRCEVSAVHPMSEKWALKERGRVCVSA